MGLTGYQAAIVSLGTPDVYVRNDRRHRITEESTRCFPSRRDGHSDRCVFHLLSLPGVPDYRPRFLPPQRHRV